MPGPTDPARIAELVRALAGHGTTTVYEAIGKVGDVGPWVHCLAGPGRLLGPAFTVRTPRGHNLSVLEAIAVAPGGAVLVIDCAGDESTTVWGGTSSQAAAVRGLAGMVTRAAVRDVAQMRQVGFPVFAAGVNLRGADKTARGELQVPVTLGGQTVCPGDLVMADEDGVLVIASRHFDGLLDRTTAQAEKETRVQRELASGRNVLEALGLDKDILQRDRQAWKN